MICSVSLENIYRLIKERQWRRPPIENVTHIQSVNSIHGSPCSHFSAVGSCSGFPPAGMKILNLCIFWESKEEV